MKIIFFNCLPSIIKPVFRLFAVVVFAFIAGQAAADTLPSPQGKVILTISGAIQQTNGGGNAAFDRLMLESLPQHKLAVTTPWTDGVTEFSGPLLLDVMNLVDIGNAQVLKTIALNDYAVDVPMADLRSYGVIMAMSMNGKSLSVRDKGPLWVIYPWTDDHPELHDENYHSRSIWQLARIEVR